MTDAEQESSESEMRRGSDRRQEVAEVEEAMSIIRNEHPFLVRCPTCGQLLDKEYGPDAEDGLPPFHFPVGSVDICYPKGGAS